MCTVSKRSAFKFFTEKFLQKRNKIFSNCVEISMIRVDWNKFKKGIQEFEHPFFILGVLLTVVEYGVYLAGLDYMIKIGFLVTHHLFEVAGMFSFGLFLGRLVRKYFKTIIGHSLPWIFFLVSIMMEISLKGFSFVLLFAAYFLYIPLLIGFYIYLAISLRFWWFFLIIKVYTICQRS